MRNYITINNKINNFRKTINVSGDKSISIRWILFASLANGKSKARNLLYSEDVLAAIRAIKKLGIKTIYKNKEFIIYGKGINGYKYRKNIKINAENSGTLGRLLLGLLINSKYTIKLVGDKSLSKRDFKRVTDPLSKFGAKFKLNKNKNLPLTIKGTSNFNSVKYFENKGSAQCKSSVIFGGLRSNKTTFIRAKKSRNHTELLCKYLKLPLIIKNKKNYDEIKIRKIKSIKPLNYNIPSDISSSAFFIILAVLLNKSEITVKNVNVNPSRVGVITILKKMGIKIILKNKRIYKGETVSDIYVKSPKTIKSINCPSDLNSGAIDEFLVIFLVAAKANGTSYFKNLSELNQKESPRLKWGSYILNEMGIKTITTKDSIRIYGNPKLNLKKKNNY